MTPGRGRGGMKTSRLALALGALAHFVSLGGDALAERAFIALKKDSVRSKQIKNGTIKTADLGKAVTASVSRRSRPNGVGGTEMADNAIDSNAVASGSLDAVDVGKASGSVTLNFPNIDKGECRSLTFAAGISVEGETVVVTPGSSFLAARSRSRRPSTTTT